MVLTDRSERMGVGLTAAMNPRMLRAALVAAVLACGLASHAGAQEQGQGHDRGPEQRGDRGPESHGQGRSPGEPSGHPPEAPHQQGQRPQAPHGEAPRPEAPQGHAPRGNFAPPARAEGPRGGFNEPREHDGRGMVLDNRYNHGHYYPPFGTVRNALPGEYHPYYHGGDRFYFSGGIWYAPRGPGFVVVRPPVGLSIAVLPPYYSTVWIGGLPYYYADDVYYTWQPDQNGYVVADPPTDADQPTAPPDDAGDDLIVYPKNGQGAEQQAADRYECHSWAKGQTGFDPTQPGGGVSGDVDRIRNNYNRAMSACLQARGYEVK
jgi:hypothetical protein